MVSPSQLRHFLISFSFFVARVLRYSILSADKLFPRVYRADVKLAHMILNTIMFECHKRILPILMKQISASLLPQVCANALNVFIFLI